MHENKFEKQVREKMDELGFVPSDAVWAGVDQEINKDKKRRRPIFWLLLFFGLFLGGGAYYFSSENHNPVTHYNEGKDKSLDTLQGRETIPTGKNKIREKTKNETAESIAESNQSTTKSSLEKLSVRKRRETAPEQNLVAAVRGNSEIKDNQEATGIDEKKLQDGRMTDSASVQKMNGAARNKTADEALAAGSVENKTAGRDSNPEIAENKTAGKDSVPGSNAAAKSGKENSSLWKIGVDGGVGFSNTNQSLFQSAYPANSPTYGGATGSPGTGSMNYASYPEIKAGFSFGIGLFANRHISKRVSFSAGLGYHYYSTKMNTGNLVDSSISINSPYLQTTFVNAYYRNGRDQSYINHYHFIELPVSVNFQLNNSPHLPVIWEAGFSVAYLLGSNSLHYDPLTNVFFQNNNLLSRTQFSLATAIMVGFRLGQNELQVGPQLQYGLTSLLKSGTGEDWHLFYGGLKISFIPGKK